MIISVDADKVLLIKFNTHLYKFLQKVVLDLTYLNIIKVI